MVVAVMLRARLLLSVVVMTVLGGLVIWFSTESSLSWAAVADTLGQVGPADAALLALVWAAGLWCHSWVLTTAMAGLSRRRALLLNVCSSAVADLIPFGAAAGTGVQLAMIRGWNLPLSRFAGFTAISNLWNVLAKLALPAVVLGLTLLSGSIHSTALLAITQAALAFSLGLALLAVLVIAQPRVTQLVGRLADALSHAVFRRFGSARTTRLGQALPAIRNDMADVIRHGWLKLTAGVIGYLLLQGVLWWLCLQAVGGSTTLAALAAGFTVERVLSMLPFTPGGAGLAEAGSIGLLVSLGSDPVTATAGVLLFRAFAFLLEIPVGGAGLLGWWWLRRRRRLRLRVAAGLAL